MSCCIPYCKAVANINEHQLNFYQFPANLTLASKWIENINSLIDTKGTFYPEPCAFVCSKHFLPSDFVDDEAMNIRRLKPQVVPTVFDDCKPAPGIRKRKLPLRVTESPTVVKVSVSSQTVQNQLTTQSQSKIQQKTKDTEVVRISAVNVSSSQKTAPKLPEQVSKSCASATVVSGIKPKTVQEKKQPAMVLVPIPSNKGGPDLIASSPTILKSIPKSQLPDFINSGQMILMPINSLGTDMDSGTINASRIHSQTIGEASQMMMFKVIPNSKLLNSNSGNSQATTSTHNSTKNLSPVKCSPMMLPPSAIPKPSQTIKPIESTKNQIKKRIVDPKKILNRNQLKAGNDAKANNLETSTKSYTHHKSRLARAKPQPRTLSSSIPDVASPAKVPVLLNKTNLGSPKKVIDSSQKKSKTFASSNLLKIGPNSYLKINPDIIQTISKKTPSGDTVLQFVMNPKLLKLSKKSPFEVSSKPTMDTTPAAYKKDQEPPSVIEPEVMILSDSDGNTDDVNSFIVDKMSTTAEQDRGSQSEVLYAAASSTVSSTTPAVLSTTTPVKFSLTNFQTFGCSEKKYESALLKKTKMVRNLTTQVARLKKKIDDLENKLGIQEFKLTLDIVKQVRRIKMGARNGESHANFILEQIKGYRVKKIHWSETTLNQCSAWCRKAPYAYEIFKRGNLFSLPALKTVREYLKLHPEVAAQLQNGTLVSHPKLCSGDESSSDFEFEEDDDSGTKNLSNAASKKDIVDITEDEVTSVNVTASLEQERKKTSDMEQKQAESVIILSEDSVNSAKENEPGELVIEAETDENINSNKSNVSSEIIHVPCISSTNGVAIVNINGQQIVIQPQSIANCSNSNEDYYIIPSADIAVEKESQNQAITYIVSNDEHAQEQVIYIS